MKCMHSTVLAYLTISETIQIPIKYSILVLLLLEVGKYGKNMNGSWQEQTVKIIPTKTHSGILIGPKHKRNGP
jgi:hypothetical protein